MTTTIETFVAKLEETVTPSIATAVLGYLEDGPLPGGFMSSLYHTILKADRINLELLRNAYPGEVAAIDAYKNEELGRDALLIIRTR